MLDNNTLISDDIDSIINILDKVMSDEESIIRNNDIDSIINMIDANQSFSSSELLSKIFVLINKIVPQEVFEEESVMYATSLGRRMVIFSHRCIFTKLSWSVPTMSSLNEIIDFAGTDKVLEVGSGTGLWSHLMSLSGIKLESATDVGSSGDYFSYNNATKIFYLIEFVSGPDAVQKYSDTNVLFMSWPPMSSMAFDTLKLFSGQKLIFIGEDCTASEDFFDLLNKDWMRTKSLSIGQWSGFNDRNYEGCFQRK